MYGPYVRPVHTGVFLTPVYTARTKQLFYMVIYCKFFVEISNWQWSRRDVDIFIPRQRMFVEFKIFWLQKESVVMSRLQIYILGYSGWLVRAEYTGRIYMARIYGWTFWHPYTGRKYGCQKMHPYVRAVHTARTYGPYVRVVHIGLQTNFMYIIH